LAVLLQVTSNQAETKNVDQQSSIVDKFSAEAVESDLSFRMGDFSVFGD